MLEVQQSDTLSDLFVILPDGTPAALCVVWQPSRAEMRYLNIGNRTLTFNTRGLEPTVVIYREEELLTQRPQY